ncbi:HNH endonuclease, partial [Salisediminibacterium halotolerans]
GMISKWLFCFLPSQATNIEGLPKPTFLYCHKQKKLPRTGEWFGEVGDGIYHASKHSLENTGQFIDGAVRGGYGVAKSNRYHKETARADLQESSGRIGKGLKNSASFTGKSAYNAVTGYSQGDYAKGHAAMRDVAKVGAVAFMGVGVLEVAGFDVVTGADTEELDTRNMDIEGSVHPETGVPFEQQTVTLSNGSDVSGVYPVFDSSFTAAVPAEVYTEDGAVHNAIANEQLHTALSADPMLASQMDLSAEQLEQVSNGETPDGMVWHHHEQPGKMQLVDEATHAQTAHSGGTELWGSGSVS